MKSVLFFALWLLALASWITPVRATVILPLSLEQMAARASLIFEGRVTAVETRLDTRSQRVATFTTFEVLDAIKGAPGSSHTIKQVGGRLPGSAHELRIHGVPRFEPGQSYVVFLPAPSRLGFASPLGLSQGVYGVSEQAGQRVVRQPDRSRTAGRSTLTPAARAKPAAAGTARFTSLDAFKTTLRSMVSQ